MDWISLINLETIPAWIAGLVMIYTAIIWLVTRNRKIRMDSSIMAYTLLTWGTIYSLSTFSSTTGSHEELIVRILMSRVVIIFICLSQSLPLTISYIRGIRRENGTAG